MRAMTHYLSVRRHLARALLASSLLPLTALAQDFPTQAITWVVGYPPGGGSDMLARAVSAQMASQLGVPVTVENRPGAGASIGAGHVAKAPADGYTVMTADNGVLVYNPVLYKQLPYDAMRDFAAIGLMARTPLILAAAPDAGFSDLQSLMAAVRQQPGKLQYGSPGNGSPHHLAMEMLLSRVGMQMTHMPLSGAAQAVKSAVAGAVPAAVVDASSSLASIKSDKLVPLAVFSLRRLPQLPQVPTLIELGYKDVEAYAWQGMVVPQSTPIAARQRLSAEMQQALRQPSLKARLQAAGWEPVPTDAVLMNAYLVAERGVWQPLIRARRIAIE